jgi:hypothetical protein
VEVNDIRLNARYQSRKSDCRQCRADETAKRRPVLEVERVVVGSPQHRLIQIVRLNRPELADVVFDRRSIRQPDQLAYYLRNTTPSREARHQIKDPNRSLWFSNDRYLVGMVRIGFHSDHANRLIWSGQLNCRVKASLASGTEDTLPT